MQNYHNLLVWRKAHALALQVHRLTESMTRGSNTGLIGQMRRAATSISANIAEGSGRATDKDFAKFLQVAFGSSSELEYHLEFAADAGLLSKAEFEARRDEIIEIRKMLSGLIKKLRNPQPVS